jgi:hypothetical protein
VLWKVPLRRREAVQVALRAIGALAEEALGEAELEAHEHRSGG